MPPELRVQLDYELPRAVRSGGGTAVFVAGLCFSPGRRLETVELVVGGRAQPVLAYREPRLDAVEATGDASAYRSGFWGFARIEPQAGAGGVIELGVRAGLDTGEVVAAGLGRIVVEPSPAPEPVAWPAATGPRVAICLATRNPPAELFERQIDSIRGQAHRNWVCLISDDASETAAYQRILAAVRDDERFIVSRGEARLGFYRNFERALGMAPAGAEYVALADQDDVWDEDKLAVLLERIGSNRLIYSEARIVAPDGRTISERFWNRRRNNHESLLSLLVANAVPGAASLLRRDLLDAALPFPPAQFAHFHDHWIALTALATGDIGFVPTPLYSYVQHDGASLGWLISDPPVPWQRRLLRRRDPRQQIRSWRHAYFVDYLRLVQFATVLKLRCAERMTPGRLAELEVILQAERSPAAWGRLAARAVRELAGSTSETLGAEWLLFNCLGWRRLMERTASEQPRPGRALDALPPETLIAYPASAPGAAPATALPASARRLQEKLAPLAFSLSADAPERVNLLIPTIDLDHFFGGYITKLNLARRLAEHGHRVRIVTVDPVPALPAGWQRTLESYSGLAGVFDRVEVAFGRQAAAIETSSRDSFIATTWWTAHLAHRAAQQVGGGGFVYLIQEYEPFTFPMGAYAALAEQSYRLPHAALFSSELLRGYFREQALGVYASGPAVGDERSRAFQNAITPVRPPPADELTGRRPRRLLFYARPEPHAARNMFELGVLALIRAAEAGTFAGEWELHGVGTVGMGGRIPVDADRTLELLPRTGQSQYARLLREHDLGLALMYTPHPSLVPLEMAAAGLVTVTNSFAGKTPGALAELSENLIVAEPTVEGVAAALARAGERVDDVERRVRDSAVRWATSWDECFDQQLIEFVTAWLHRLQASPVA